MPLITKHVLAPQSARISATLTNTGSLRPISHSSVQASSIGPNPALQLAHLATTADASNNINKTSGKNNGATHQPQSGQTNNAKLSQRLNSTAHSE